MGLSTKEALVVIVTTAIDSQQTIPPTVYQLNRYLTIAGEMFNLDKNLHDSHEMALRDLIAKYKLV